MCVNHWPTIRWGLIRMTHLLFIDSSSEIDREITSKTKGKKYHKRKRARGRTKGILSLAFWSKCILPEAAARLRWFHRKPSTEQWWQVRAASAVADWCSCEWTSLGFSSQHGLISFWKTSYTTLPSPSCDADIDPHVNGQMKRIDV